jgi:hypothetical protein
VNPSRRASLWPVLLLLALIAALTLAAAPPSTPAQTVTDSEAALAPEETVSPRDDDATREDAAGDFATPTPTPAGQSPEETDDATEQSAESEDTQSASQDAAGSSALGSVSATERARRAEAMRTNPGYGNAARQSLEGKEAEAAADCVPARPPISPMLGTDSRTSGDPPRRWPWQVLFVAVGASLVAAAAWVWRRRSAGARRGAGPDAPARGVLETVAVVVAMVGGLIGVAGELGARFAGGEPPPRRATLTVREVHPRVTFGEFARKTTPGLEVKSLDQRQVGVVIWVEIELAGYRGRELWLQRGLYDGDVGEVLLPETDKRFRLKLEAADHQTLVTAIWVGYPQSRVFKAQLRLFEGTRVQQMASTGLMRGSTYRYSCKREIHGTRI